MEQNKRKAFQLILLFGLVSLLGDTIYEGARSVNGPYLKLLGANALLVGFIAGAGEFLGYGIRLLSGYFSDKTKAYWFFTILGYGMLLSVPLLALTGIWQIAALLIVTERIGKAMRSPAKDTILSQATKQVGTGFGFGLNEAMDQIGAIAGPLLFTFLFVADRIADKRLADYQHGYGLLWIPFGLLMACVFFAYLRVPNPEVLETPTKMNASEKLPRIFWLYAGFSFFATMGFVNFVLMAYHFKAKHVLSDVQIPLFYAMAMGVDGAAALVIGKIYDRMKEKQKHEWAGIGTLLIIPLLSVVIPFLSFTTTPWIVILSILIWGVVMAAHETIIKSAIADITPLKKRGTGYGILNVAYGLAMLAGGTLMGFLYDRSLPALMAGVVVIELVSLPFFFAMKKEVLKN
ncbi:MAG TPA: MFS transporter [Candidatus Omnitrophota bacterium]|nr:MFS transporter [Candidatus Omnitrophota bacterium]HPS36303.1 MFS transporter [Candidatus Omnitrophota bacterium]